MFFQPVESRFEILDSMKTVCQFIKIITTNQTELNTQFDTIMQAFKKISIEKEILVHENANLFKALIKKNVVKEIEI